ncbi:alpha/beta hydrolase [Streptomyces iconiensis]|uniref:Alpha/beta hydrolase n=1 Tax=Streptomyces iconiensis TaxID=1384038 RepID=A0ABT7A5Q7_9ACTN|nr:alpha/beta hydrolase [Streptomyces iconiensis]MDJ1136660.1 alpha/beta hydrolase [Streptomyces iconiensis]
MSAGMSAWVRRGLARERDASGAHGRSAHTGGARRAGSVPRGAALLAAAALVLTGCTDGGGDPERTGKGPGEQSSEGGPAAPGGGKLAWKSCPGPTAKQYQVRTAPEQLPDGTSWQCAKLRVPLDHGKPDGTHIDLAVVRAQAAKKARSQGKHKGSLVFNFGGPGGSGVAVLPLTAPKSYEKLREGYDLVSFDPRGVGESAGVKCRTDKQADADFAADTTPDSPAEEKALLALQKESVASCEKRAGKVLPHLTTENTARDMDLLRAALGEERLNYFGISYGAQLGGVYAHLFPERVGRTVLDAPVDPTLGMREMAVRQTAGFQHALDNYLRDCAEKLPRCPMGKDPKKGPEQLSALLKKIDKKPLSTASGRKVTESLALTGIGASLYSQETWMPLSMALQEAKNGKGDTLLTLADAYTGRGEDGKYTNSQEAGTAINCADSKTRYTPQEAKKYTSDFRAASPVFGPSQVWGLAMCDGWPVRGSSDRVEVGTESDAPIVVLGNTGDPATPYAGARKMTDAIGGGARLVTYKGEGHSSYDAGDTCVKAAVDGFLLDGKAPRGGTVCP